MNASILYESGAAGIGYGKLVLETRRPQGTRVYRRKLRLSDRRRLLENTQAVLVRDGREERIEVRQFSDFTGEIEHGCQCIERGLSESPVLEIAASLEIMKVLEAVKESGRAEKSK